MESFVIRMLFDTEDSVNILKDLITRHHIKKGLISEFEELYRKYHG